jgi:hypothetical protein
MASAALMLSEVHNAVALVDAYGDRAVARRYRGERVAAAGAESEEERDVGD